jgi:anaerobic selenocysteine-containing dehydrogenase
LRSDGNPGFETPTGKCEIWSTRLENLRYEPIPYYINKYPSDDVLENFPLILTDGRTLEIYHGLGLTLPSRRKRTPDPIIEIHPDTADKLEIKGDDWVWIQTHQNKNRFKRKVVLSSTLHPTVVWCNSHFHYPEKRSLRERLEPSINLSHTLEGPHDPIDGASSMRGVPCRITRD